jgi:hypothetical protein
MHLKALVKCRIQFQEEEGFIPLSLGDAFLLEAILSNAITQAARLDYPLHSRLLM